MNNIGKIEAEIAQLQEELRVHKLYSELQSIDDIKTFMEWHVYAVWDFMSLLKSLQSSLTCTEVPWKPAANPSLSRFINEIVHGEESDIDEKGRSASHYEMYLNAMKEVGAKTEPIKEFVAGISSLSGIIEDIENASLPKAVKEFLTFTFNTIQTNEPHLVASAFTFGREDLIPDMFLAIINKSGNDLKYPKLKYYLERHIELDGDEHGPLSLQMIVELCGNDQQKWEGARKVAVVALQKRVQLWDGIAEAISKSKLEFA
ncbi:DUF3050 domain-containing protein [Jiulongibacter sp. NS-SX5]|uniref:DUF3050 domain-containing protein n=1 Tax=Jiulongibacter sp. NS-SX5 TaxID=3463854 RepID=UPI004058E10C